MRHTWRFQVQSSTWKRGEPPGVVVFRIVIMVWSPRCWGIFVCEAYGWYLGASQSNSARKAAYGALRRRAQMSSTARGVRRHVLSPRQADRPPSPTTPAFETSADGRGRSSRTGCRPAASRARTRGAPPRAHDAQGPPGPLREEVADVAHNVHVGVDHKSLARGSSRLRSGHPRVRQKL